jgi:hypothetical protein
MYLFLLDEDKLDCYEIIGIIQIVVIWSFETQEAVDTG